MIIALVHWALKQPLGRCVKTMDHDRTPVRNLIALCTGISIPRGVAFWLHVSVPISPMALLRIFRRLPSVSVELLPGIAVKALGSN